VYIHLHLPSQLSPGLLQLGNLYQRLQSIQNTAAGQCEHITPILREMHWRLYDAKTNSSTPRLSSRHCMARHWVYINCRLWSSNTCIAQKKI